MPRRSAEDSARARAAILARAVDLASVEGLGGLSIGRLAQAVNLSKSGLFAYFGSLEELQAAVVETAAEVFHREVVETRPPAGGLESLVGLAEGWIRYIERGHFRGGCFFAAAAAEMDDRPGRIRDRLSSLTREWVGLLEGAAREAVDAGHLDDEADPAQLAFEIHAFTQEANWSFQLHGDPEAFGRARRAVRRSLAQHSSPAGRRILAQGGLAE